MASSFEHADAPAATVTQGQSIELFALPAASFDLPTPRSNHTVVGVIPAPESRSDAALTYLRTGRLRL